MYRYLRVYITRKVSYDLFLQLSKKDDDQFSIFSIITTAKMLHFLDICLESITLLTCFIGT